jgi:hypothetical protein
MTHFVGTYSLEDLLKQRFVPASQFGFQYIAAAIQARLDWLNAQVSEQMGLLAETTSDVRRIYGTSEHKEMVEVDEIGIARTSKDKGGVEVDFPLRKFSVATGWTWEFLQRATPADIARDALDNQVSYVERIRNELAYGFFNKSNYSFKDWTGDNTALAVKAFHNADSTTIPDAPDGTAFNGVTHQHYVGTVGASLAYTDIDTLISNVREHGNIRGLALFINAANVATLVALGSTKFVALTLNVIIPASTSVSTSVVTSVEEDPDNKLVGYWAGYPVYTRSWVPSGYYTCIATNAAQKPLVHRIDKIATLNGFHLEFKRTDDPFSSEFYSAYVGFGAWNRSAAAFLDGGAQTTYVNPSGLVR